jgi:hypothetical protein
MKNRIKMLLLLSMAASSVVLNASFNDDGSPENPAYEWAVARWMNSDDVSEQEHYERELTAASAYGGHRYYVGRPYGLEPGDSFYYLGCPHLAQILATGNPAAPAQAVAAQAAQPQAVQPQAVQPQAVQPQAVSAAKNSGSASMVAAHGGGGGSSEKELAQELINDPTIHTYFRTRSSLSGEPKASPGASAMAQSATALGGGGGGGDAPESAEKQDADLKKKLNRAISRRDYPAFKAVLHNPKLLDLDCRNAVGNTVFRACLFLAQDFFKALINSDKQISQWDADNLLDYINRLRCVPILDKASRNKETKLKKIEQFLVNDTGGRDASGKSDGTCRFRYTNTPAERRFQPEVVSAADSDTSTADAASASASSAPVRAAKIATAATAVKAQLAAVPVKRSATAAGVTGSTVDAPAPKAQRPTEKATKRNTQRNSGSGNDSSDDGEL